MKKSGYFFKVLFFLLILNGPPAQAQVFSLNDYLRFTTPWDLHPIVRQGKELTGLIAFPYINIGYNGSGYGDAFLGPNYPITEDGAFRVGADFKNIGGLFDAEVFDADLSYYWTTFDMGSILSGTGTTNYGHHLTGAATWFSLLETAVEWESFREYNFFNFQANLVDFSWIPGEDLFLGYQPKSMGLFNYVRVEGGSLRNYSNLIRTGFPYLPYLSTDYSYPPDVWIFQPQLKFEVLWFRPILTSSPYVWSGFEFTIDWAFLIDPDYKDFQPENLHKIDREAVNKGDVEKWIFGLTLRDQVYDPFTGLEAPYFKLSVTQYGFVFFGPFAVIQLEVGFFTNRNLARMFNGDFGSVMFFIKADFQLAFGLKEYKPDDEE